MSYFGTCLDEQIKAKRMKAVDLANTSKVPESTISRLRNETQPWVSPDDLGRIATAISDDPRVQAQLLRAYLLDQVRGPGSELVEVRISGEQAAGKLAYKVKLSGELEEDFEVIREWIIKDQDVREIIQRLANLLRSGDCRIKGQPESSKPKPVGRVKRYPVHRRKTQAMEADPSMNEKPGPQKPDRTIKLSETERS